MKQTKRIIRKLSSSVAVASMQETTEKLNALQQLTKESARVGEELGQLISHLRQVAAPAQEPFLFTESMDANVKLLHVVFRDCDDVKYRTVEFGKRKALLVYVEGMASSDLIQDAILDPLLEQDNQTIRSIHNMAVQIPAASLKSSRSALDCITSILNGFTGIFLEGDTECLLVNTVKYQKRSVSSPEVETVIMGPHEAFNEVMADSIALLRRRCRDNNLKVRMLHIGERNKTGVAMVYIANLIKPGLVEEVEQRLEKVKIDRMFTSSMLSEFICDHPWAPFPQVQLTERPDKVAASLYEGRLAIIVDNMTEAVLLPVTFNQLLQSPEDYGVPALVTSLVRLTRFVSAMVAIFLPGLYIALVAFHPGMMPTSLAISVSELRLRAPFPAFMEAMFMEILLELFQEAVVRLPQKISGAAGVVGALIIGTTVVEAGLVNALLVVVTAISAITSFSMPSYSLSLALRFLRIPAMIAAAVLGVYGVVLSFLVIITHMCALRNLGESFAGDQFNITLLEDWKDMMVRLPATWQTSRPKLHGVQERDRGGKEDG